MRQNGEHWEKFATLLQAENHRQIASKAKMVIINIAIQYGETEKMSMDILHHIK